MACEYAQGYALSHPVPAADFPRAGHEAEQVARATFADAALLP
jgi:EAL domain-containing protein (putative c-di-GMP-specific phosphodiesterase class I)